MPPRRALSKRSCRGISLPSPARQRPRRRWRSARPPPHREVEEEVEGP